MAAAVEREAREQQDAIARHNARLDRLIAVLAAPTPASHSAHPLPLLLERCLLDDREVCCPRIRHRQLTLYERPSGRFVATRAWRVSRGAWFDVVTQVVCSPVDQ